jgi:hypothetical protein
MAPLDSNISAATAFRTARKFICWPSSQFGDPVTTVFRYPNHEPSQRKRRIDWIAASLTLMAPNRKLPFGSFGVTCRRFHGRISSALGNRQTDAIDPKRKPNGGGIIHATNV